MIDTTYELPVIRQAQLLDLPWSSVYDESKPVSEGNSRLLRHVHYLQIECLFAGGLDAGRRPQF